MLYRPFFLDAWRLTWERKRLWIFGIFAALLSTGGVVDVAWRTLERVERAESLLVNLADASFMGYGLAASYIGQMAALGPERGSALVIAATLIGLLLLIMAVLSQGALVLGIRAKTLEDPHALRAQAAGHFWSLLLIGLFNKIVMAVLMVLMTLVLWLSAFSGDPADVAVFFTLLVLFIPATVVVSIIYLFALIDTVETGDHPLQAIHTGARLFARQWLSALEFGLLLFALVLVAGVAFIALLVLLLVPYSILFSATLLTGSFSLFLFINVLFALALLLAILLFGGALVTFQYGAWYNFYKRGVHKMHGKKTFSKILRLAYR